MHCNDNDDDNDDEEEIVVRKHSMWTHGISTYKGYRSLESFLVNGPPDISSTNRATCVTRIYQSAFRHDVYHSSVAFWEGKSQGKKNRTGCGKITERRVRKAREEKGKEEREKRYCVRKRKKKEWCRYRGH